MLGTLVNTGAVIVGSVIGLLLGKLIPKKLGDSILCALALCVLYIGIDGAIQGENTLTLILSILIGALIGNLLDLDGKLNKFGDFIEHKFKPAGDGKSSIAHGFVTASLLFCVGAMSIVGSLQSGLNGDNTTIYLKSVLDFVSSIVFASQLGAGVILSAVFIFLYQGAIVALAQWVAPFLSDTVIAEMTCAGSVLIIGIALNMLGITKLKIMNYVPAILIAGILQTLFNAFA